MDTTLTSTSTCSGTVTFTGPMREARGPEIERAGREERQRDCACCHTPAAAARNGHEHPDEPTGASPALSRLRRDGGQVGGDEDELTVCPRPEGEPDPVGELLEAQSTGRRRFLEPDDGSLAIGIRDSMLVAHVRGPLYLRSTSAASSSTAGIACCSAAANGEPESSPSERSSRRDATPSPSR